VAVERSPEGVESLAIQADSPFTPDVFPLEGKNPFGSSRRLVVDVKNVASVARSVDGRDLHGTVIHRVRTAYDPKARSFRAVLDLAPDTPYRSEGRSSPDGEFVLRLTKMGGGAGPEPAVQVRAITFRASDGSGEERLLIQADRFFEPVVFGLEGANPFGEDARIVVDIPGARAPAPGQAVLRERGHLVRDVRTHYHARAGKLRVVLDLAPAAGYKASQTFFEKQNLYCLSITEAPGGDGPGPSPRRKQAREELPPPQSDPVVPPDLLALDTAARPEPGPLRSRAVDLDEAQIRAMFRRHGFYSTCGIYNARYCNQNGDFANHLRACGQDAICDDATGLMWERKGSDGPMAWEEAASHIRERNRRGIGGYDDWRLPTLEELLSLMERSWGDGGLYLNDLFDSGPRSCWSVDTRGDSRAWKVNYHLGYAVDALVEERNWVRAVRGLEPPSTWARGDAPGEPEETRKMARQAPRP
jgi:hypothetical protein